MAGQDPTPALPAGVLTPEVAAALGDGLVVEELTHNAGNQATGGIWPVAGPAGRAVCKLVTAAGGGDPAWATSDDPHHWNAWNREALAYRCGFAAGVYADAGLGAPRLLAMAEAPPPDHLPPGRVADEPDRPRRPRRTRSSCSTGRSVGRGRSARTSAT
jgi:hypothetical protein